jgi:hypothetical protein
MSYRRMTKKERKEHIRKRYRSPKDKIYALSVFIVIMAVLVYAFIISLNQNIDPILPVLVLIGIIITFMIGLFFIDMIFWESE